MAQDLATQLQTLSKDADYFGIADLAPARDFILAQGGEQVAQYVFARLFLLSCAKKK